jgi:hypothetical protein
MQIFVVLLQGNGFHLQFLIRGKPQLKVEVYCGKLTVGFALTFYWFLRLGFAGVVGPFGLFILGCL